MNDSMDQGNVDVDTYTVPEQGLFHQLRGRRI